MRNDKPKATREYKPDTSQLFRPHSTRYKVIKVIAGQKWALEFYRLSRTRGRGFVCQMKDGNLSEDKK